MTYRLSPLLMMALALLNAANSVLAQADPFQPSPQTIAIQTQIKNALRTANDGNFADAVGQLEKVLKQSPDNRDALFFMTFVAGVAADKLKDGPEKIAMLRRSDAAYDRLVKRYHPLDREELALGETAKLSDARIALLENKPEQALDELVKLVMDGYSKPLLFDLIPKIETVHKLPNFEPKMLKAHQVGIQPLLAKYRPFPFDFALKNVDGKVMKLDDLKGEVTIVDVWGTWCPPCREEIPHFVDLAKRYSSHGLKVVGINCNEEGGPAEVRKTVNDFIAANKIPYPCLINDDTIESKIPDFDGAYPTTLFLDRTGKVRLKLMGNQPLSRLEAVVTTLLAESTH